MGNFSSPRCRITHLGSRFICPFHLFCIREDRLHLSNSSELDCVRFALSLQAKTRKGYEKTDSIFNDVPRGDSLDCTEHQRQGD